MDGHMTDVEALMWTLEKDPHLSSTFANITILDRTPDVDRLRHRMERALSIVPRRCGGRIQTSTSTGTSVDWRSPLRATNGRCSTSPPR
jgi:hypothetical protein